MPTRDLFDRFRRIHRSCKDLNMKWVSQPVSGQARNAGSKRQTFDIPSKSCRYQNDKSRLMRLSDPDANRR
jgi:hypothetical protein